MTTAIISKELEIRHLSTQIQLQLVKLLDIDDSVLSLLMGTIVKDLDNAQSELRFSSADIDAIRMFANRHNKPAILVLLDEWSTMGRNRPKLKHLLELFVKCQLFQAADYVAELLNEPYSKRPTSGPAASVDISLTNEDIEGIVNQLDYPFSSIDLTAKVNRVNNYIKPDFHSPMSNYVNNNGSTETTQSRIFNQLEVSDMIKFSVAMPVENNSSNDIPALSGLMSTPNDSQQTNSQLPIVLQSIEQKSESYSNGIPDFSGLMVKNDEESSENSRIDESMTESTMSTFN